MPLLKKRHRRVGVEVAERPCSSQNSTLQSEHGRWGERDKVTHPLPKKKDGPYKGSFCAEFQVPFSRMSRE